MSTRRAAQSGVTLVELVMFIVIVGVALFGLVRIFAMNNSASADPVARKQAMLIAESLLEEVQQAGITWCDPASANAATAANAAACDIPEGWGQEVAGQDRPYDNVNDYVSGEGVATAAFTNAGGYLTDSNGEVFINSTSYSATVQVRPQALNGITGGAGVLADAFLIRIEVHYGTLNDFVALEGYRTRYAPAAIAP